MCVCRLKSQIPDIQKTLDVVKFLKTRQVLLQLSVCVCDLDVLQGGFDAQSSHFMLSDGVFACAEVPQTDTVLLWLGVRECVHH